MATNHNYQARAGERGVESTDIFFECPSCGKSLVVDHNAEGLIVDCPQCHINLIVPPASETSKPVPPPKDAPTDSQMTPPAAKVGSIEVAALQQRLDTLSAQLRELRTQWEEVTGRIASRINEVNHDLVLLARLETSHKQIRKEWDSIVSEVAAAAKAGEPQSLPRK